jgi:hypothetical protein
MYMKTFNPISWKMYPFGPKSFIQNDESRKWMFLFFYEMVLVHADIFHVLSMFVCRTTRLRRFVRIQDIQQKCCYGSNRSNPFLRECRGKALFPACTAIMRRVIEKIVLSDRCLPFVSSTKRWLPWLSIRFLSFQGFYFPFRVYLRD